MHEYPLSFFGSVIFALYAVLVPAVIGLFITFGVIVILGLVIEGTEIFPYDLAEGMDRWLRYSVGWTFFGAIAIWFLACLLDLLKSWTVVRRLRKVARNRQSPELVPIHYQMHEVNQAGGAGLTVFLIGISFVFGLLAMITLGMAVFDALRDGFLNLTAGILFAITGASVGGSILMMKVVHKKFAAWRREIEEYWPKPVQIIMHNAARAYPTKKQFEQAQNQRSRLRTRMSMLAGISLAIALALLHLTLFIRFPRDKNSEVTHNDNPALENFAQFLVILTAVVFFIGGIAMLIAWVLGLIQRSAGREHLASLVTSDEKQIEPDPVVLSQQINQGWVMREGQWAGFGAGLLTMNGTALWLGNRGTYPFNGLQDYLEIGATVGVGLTLTSVALTWYGLVFQRSWRNELHALWPMRPKPVGKDSSIDSWFRKGS